MKLPYHVWLALVPLALAACAPSYESACQSFCDKAAECADEAVSDAELADCKRQCTSNEVEAQLELDRGTATQECYDAVVDSFDCASGLSCQKLRSDSVPPECAEPLARIERDCDD